MRVVLQRVSSASVTIDGDTVGAIGRGLVALVGMEEGDGLEQVEAAARKLSGLRVFADDEGRMNLGPQEADAAFLVVSQFTLAGNLAKGRRPSFDKALPPEEAELLIEALVSHLRHHGFDVATGEFGAHMAVELVNDGPVTLVLEIGPDGRVST